MGHRAVLIREAQQVGTQHSRATAQLLESLVRESSVMNGERVLQLLRQLEAEAGQPRVREVQPVGRTRGVGA